MKKVFLTLEILNQLKWLVLKIYLKYLSNFTLSNIKFMTLYFRNFPWLLLQSEELNYQFVFPSPPHFSKLYMHYTYIYQTSYFDLIVDSSSVKNSNLHHASSYLEYLFVLIPISLGLKIIRLKNNKLAWRAVMSVIRYLFISGATMLLS